MTSNADRAWPVASTVALVAAFGMACGSGGETLRDTLPDPTGAPPGENGPGAVRDAGSQTSVPAWDASGQIVYLLDAQGALRRFDPTLAPSPSAFQTVGQTSCALADGGAWAGASDLSVDESGGVWVTDVAGHLFTVSTADAACQPTSFQPGQSGFSKMGMSFVGGSDGTETLYVVDNVNGPASTAGLGLAKVDVASFLLTPIGNFDGGLQGRVAELAGTKDGRLYGFFPGVDSWVAEIDPSTAHILSSTQVPISLAATGPTHVDTAVSLFGGVFYMYVANTGIAPFTDVSAFNPATGTTGVVFPQIGFNVLGAGVATCTPPVSTE